MKKRSISRTGFHPLLTPSVLGEAVLLLLTGAFFAYMLWGSREWPLGAAFMPRLVVLFTLPFWMLRAIGLVRTALLQQAPYDVMRNEDEATGQIMDMGFYLGQDRRAAMRRFMVVCSAIGMLLIGIWTLGWHVSLPVWLFVYLRFLAHTSIVMAAVSAAVFIGVVVGMYDLVLNAGWNEPLVVKWWDRITGT